MSLANLCFALATALAFPMLRSLIHALVNTDAVKQLHIQYETNIRAQLSSLPRQIHSIPVQTIVRTHIISVVIAGLSGFTLSILLDLRPIDCLSAAAFSMLACQLLVARQKVQTFRRCFHRQIGHWLEVMWLYLEAGDTLQAALQKSSKLESLAPLSDSLADCIEQMRAGLDMESALCEWGCRVKNPMLQQSLDSLMHCQRMGVGSFETLGLLCEQQFDERVALAEQRAARIPLLMLAPLLSCFFPAILILLIYPALSQIILQLN